MSLLSASFKKALLAEQQRIQREIGKVEAEMDARRDDLDELRGMAYHIGLLVCEEWDA